MAVKAGEAWRPTGAGSLLTCGGGTCYTVTAGGECATWCYQSLLAGRVVSVPSIACQCPTQGSSTWN